MGKSLYFACVELLYCEGVVCCDAVAYVEAVSVYPALRLELELVLVGERLEYRYCVRYADLLVEVGVAVEGLLLLA